MAQVKYSRLIALGCSHTYGHGLKDCYIPPYGFGELPSLYAWPNELAKILKINSVINLALPGGSNKFIAHSALNFKFKPRDLVVVLWTYGDRTGIFDEDQKYNRIAAWDETNYSKQYIRSYYSSYDVSFQNTVYINYLRSYLREKNINYFYDFVDLECTVRANLCSNWVDLDFNNHMNKYSKSLDGNHMGEQGHRVWAERWAEKIQK